MRGFWPLAASALLLSFAGCTTPHYKSWADFSARNNRNIASFENWLGASGVGGVLPAEGLLKSASDWKRCKAQPWGMPPPELWPNIAPTLALVRDEIVPLVGAVEVQSGWRSYAINACVGGAPKSKHVLYSALDLTPKMPADRAVLIESLCTFWRDYGAAYNMGLGIYDGTRFHVDTGGYRTWGADYRAASSPCRTPESAR